MTTTPATPVYLASYKATQPGMLGLVNRMIRFFTKGPYSHSEIAIGNPFDAPAMCVSSVGTEGGVRAKTMQLSPAKWDLVPMHHITPADVMAFLEKHKGKGYDYIGCVRTVLPFVGREHPDHWCCSEVCADISGHTEPWRMHPNVLHAVELSRAKARPQ